MDYANIISSYHYLDIARMQLLDELEKHIMSKTLSPDIPDIKTGEAYWDGKVLHFIIPEVLPHIKVSVNREWSKKYLWHWVGLINGTFKKLNNNNIKFNKALCYIHVYMPSNGPWDIDNRCYSFVINGIKYTRVIRDDSFRYLEIYLSGDADQTNPRTEIFLTEYDNVAPHIKNFFLK